VATSDRADARRSLTGDLRHVLRRPAFHVLFWSFFICGYTTTGIIETHLIPFAAFCGFGPIPSANAYGILSAVNMAGMILVGWLTDRMHRPLLLGMIYLLRGFSFILLINLAASADYGTLILFAVAFGVVDYSTVPVTASLVESHIGLEVMGLAMGLIAAGHSVGAALGAFLGGYLFELQAHYDWVWISSIALSLLAGLLVFTLPERARPVATTEAQVA
jgi:MFS family permease